MPAWLSNRPAPIKTAKPEGRGDGHLALARESLRELLDDSRVPSEVRASLSEDYGQVENMLEKLEHGHIHIAVFGRVSVGKSALVNALLGEQRFSTSPLHGETRAVQRGRWHEFRDGNVYLIDTPGINEIDGQSREALAKEVAGRADLVLFVVDGDLTQIERDALDTLGAQRRPLLLVLNKIDRYSRAEKEQLLDVLRRHSDGLVHPDNLVTAAADPAPQWVIRVDENGRETE